jgi:ribosomal protein S18 acetylase RimI-like enzyme
MTATATGTGPSDPRIAAGCAIRRATPADAARLAALGEQAFREAWAAFNDPADMDAYCAAHFTLPHIGADLERQHVRYFLATGGGEPAGYLRTQAATPPACVAGASPAEVSRLYVLGRWHGTGLAHGLMAAGLEALASDGHDVAWLAVWRQARRAQAFYRKWGFATAGTTTFRLGRDLQADFVMQRPLSPGGRGASPWR